jgi:hypothetical protein
MREIKVDHDMVTISQTCPITARLYSLTLAYELYVDWLAQTVPTCGLGISDEDQFFLDHGISPSGQRVMQHALRETKHEQAIRKIGKATVKAKRQRRKCATPKASRRKTTSQR